MRFKDGTLAARWRKDFEGQGPAVVYSGIKPDGGLLCHFFEMVFVDGGGAKKMNLLDELERRGYDLTTIQFTIRKKEIILKGEDV